MQRVIMLGQATLRGHGKRGTGILNNELYIGRLIWNRQRYLKDPTTGRRVARPNPEDAHIVEEVPELRIVDEAFWQAVKQRQEVISRQAAEQARPAIASMALTAGGSCSWAS